MSESRIRFSTAAMSRRTLIALTAGLVVGVLAGAAVGYNLAWQQTEHRLSTEVVGNLARQVVVLSRLRTGDREGAIEILESSMDQGVVSVAASAPEVIPDAAQTFGAIKLYRSIYPSRPEVQAVLDPLPEPELGFCSAALQELAAMKSDRPSPTAAEH